MNGDASDTHRLALRVYYEDTDASGVVYHANYLRWLERGRTEWLRTKGYGQHALMEQQGVAFTIADLHIDFLRPARLDDLVEIATTVAEGRRASIVFSQAVYRNDVQLVAATVRVACVRQDDFRPARIPPDLIT